MQTKIFEILIHDLIEKQSLIRLLILQNLKIRYDIINLHRNSTSIFPLPVSAFCIRSVDGQLQGAGKFIWPNGATYDGIWHANQMHGQGRLLTASGDMFEGLFYRNFHAASNRSWVSAKVMQIHSENNHLLYGGQSQIPVVRVISVDGIRNEMVEEQKPSRTFSDAPRDANFG